MKIEQIYTGCLAQGAYYITSNGEAAIIDPLRETQPYIERIEKQKSIITVRGYKDEYNFTTSSDWLEFPKDGEDRTELLQLDHGLPKNYSVVNVERNTIGDETWFVEKVKK